MSQQDRIEALREKHAALERAIEEENRRPLPNDDMISDLKRQKLRIKDELYQLERHEARRHHGSLRPGRTAVPPGFFYARISRDRRPASHRARTSAAAP
jgi:hypothetical protein